MISTRRQFQIISSHRMARRRRSRHVRHGQNCQADRLLPLSLPYEACMDRELSVRMTEFSLSRLPRIEFGIGHHADAGRARLGARTRRATGGVLSDSAWSGVRPAWWDYTARQY